MLSEDSHFHFRPSAQEETGLNFYNQQMQCDEISRMMVCTGFRRRRRGHTVCILLNSDAGVCVLMFWFRIKNSSTVSYMVAEIVLTEESPMPFGMYIPATSHRVNNV